jgi:hypothetical protein
MASTPLPNPELPLPQGVLDDAKRRMVIALLANGSSRRAAARYVGCAPSTITRTAARDPEFARQLAVAEQTAEVDSLRAIRVAAHKDRYWRAAAWLLERKNPDDFAPRPPKAFTADQVVQMLTHIVELLRQDVPDENCQRTLQVIDQLVETCQDEASHLRWPLVQHPTLDLCEVPSPEIVASEEPQEASDVQQ